MFVAAVVLVLCEIVLPGCLEQDLDLYDEPEDFANFDNEIGTPSGKFIVPNIVHFIRWKKKFSFLEAVCLMAAVKNQKPEKVYIHSDGVIDGTYWDLAMSDTDVKSVVKLKYLEMPTMVFGQKLYPDWRYWHGADIARIKLLMEYGGIYLDNDCFVVRSLDEFRKYEMTLGWQEGMYLSNQGIIAHRNARFLRKWLNSYRNSYRDDQWYFNSGARPTDLILAKQPHLVHRMKRLFCEHFKPIWLKLRMDGTWRNHYIIHIRARELEWSSVDDNYFKGRNTTMVAMIESVYPLFKFSTKVH